MIDDDPSARRLMEIALSSLGYPVVCADNAQTGLDFVSHTRPVGIVLDLLMPTMDGFEFLARFRATSGYEDVPVIVWTTKDLTSSESQSLKNAAQATLLKGEVQPANLVADLGRLIRRQRRHQVEVAQ